MQKFYIWLFLGLLGTLNAQSGYCSSNCEGTASERLAPMEFHFDFVRSVDHFLKHPKARLRTLRHCHEAFTSTARINTITNSFRVNCDHALEAQKLAQVQP
ncbi:hypothetical protein [Helicobacter heilmannii]|uniref:hypothetical protein n=1 Tax=Helicobacter heilmannii TaxID=35817 RepID=UPI0006A09BCB|nr:hypothetical protein [Helicobacter heilmannii]CRF46524.1 hypothetical protein HHE014_15350 [Helicobacter heilmannii]CRF48818.1 hypothetical protein HHE03_03950 [Helicobacter heilmannii]